MVLQSRVNRARGLRYDSLEARKISGVEDWIGYLPIANGQGILTGIIVNIDDSDDFANLEDLALIRIDDLPRHEQERIEAEQKMRKWDGYARL